MSIKKVLCLYGVGNHKIGGEWQSNWIDALETSVGELGKDIELEISFFHYDHFFENAELSKFATLEALAKLSVSGVVFGFDDMFLSQKRRAPHKPGYRAARGVKDRLRWTAGMVVQWAENEVLREILCESLADKINDFEPDVIVAHSMGSLIAYDTFHKKSHKDVCHNRTFVSLGSQIGNPFVRSLFAGRIQPLDCGYWYHLFNIHDDVFTSPIAITDDNFEQVPTSFDVDGFADHDAARYLEHPNVTHSVWADIFANETSRAKSRKVRSLARHSGNHERKALIIGIDAYEGDDMRLEGCVNDAFLMSEVLQENGYEADEIRLLLNERATTEEIWRRLEWLLQGTKAGQLRVLCFSGHGAQLPDYGSDETVAALMKCLVPADFDWTRERAITDDRFQELYSQLPYEANFTAILDCCHSGGMTRAGGGKPRGLSPPDDIRHRLMKWDAKGFWKTRKPPNLNSSLEGNRVTRQIGYFGSNGQRRLFKSTDVLTLDNRKFNAKRKQLGHYGPYLPVILQACQEDQLAYEYRHGATSYGAFSYSLAKMLREPQNQGVNLSHLEQLTQRSVINIVSNQNPSFCCARNALWRAIIYFANQPIRRKVMKSAHKMCYDRVLPRNLTKVQRTRMIGGRDRAISLIGKQWATGSTLKIRFLGGTQDQQDMVTSIAPIWTQFANLDFEFTDDPRADIRVSFDENDGAWSYVGTDNSDIPLHAATLNLGWLDQGVILHEFGHMIGLSHEHSNPAGGIEWNEAAVIADLSGAPNFWDISTIRHNVLNKYQADQLHGTAFDEDSVMLYEFPDSWTTNMGATHENSGLSEQDKSFVASSVMYPGRGTGTSTDSDETQLEIFRGKEAEISAGGEEDSYSFQVNDAGVHLIETTGTTDVVLVLFGPDSMTRKVAEDDDAGSGRNSRIVADLQPGLYHAVVRQYDAQGTGEYRIMVSAY